MDYSQMPLMMGAAQQVGPNGQQLSPQQRLAMALMSNAQPATANGGRFSPLQGVAQIGTQSLAGRMMQQPQMPAQLGANVSPYALNNANATQDPLGTLAATQGWN